MRKEEIVRFHALLFQMRRAFESMMDVGNAFATYDQFGVTPVSLHRDRRAHELACYHLGEALSKLAVQHFGTAADLKNQLHFIHQPRAVVL